jgi:uncharacterized membrane protein
MKNVSRAGNRRRLLIGIRSSLWFVPILIVLTSALLAIGLMELDRQFMQELSEWWPRFFTVGADGSLSTLAAIASSMITVAGVVFSITIVALALASSQYTSRVLRNFMRDRTTQVVLGVFVGVYTYCLLVLIRISTGEEEAFIPSLAVWGGVILALVSIGFLIFFIHHIAASIQASTIIAAITQETLHAVDDLFPEELGQEEDEEDATPSLEPADLVWQMAPARERGYIQTVDMRSLLSFARTHDTIVRMAGGIGSFVSQGQPLAWVALFEPPDTSVVEELNDIYAIGPYRTTDQDAAFGIRQLVDIALKALSPGINDTTTAVMCVEHLSVILSHCAARRFKSGNRFNDEKPRVIASGPSFQTFVRGAFDQILENAEGNTVIFTTVLAALESIAEAARNSRRRQVLLEQVQTAMEIADRTVKSTHARTIVQQRLAQLLRHSFGWSHDLSDDQIMERLLTSSTLEGAGNVDGD